MKIFAFNVLRTERIASRGIGFILAWLLVFVSWFPCCAAAGKEDPGDLSDIVYYFAYGSNMDAVQMERRCPGSTFLGRASLEGYGFVYDGMSVTRKGPVANIVKSPEDVVWGALFILSRRDIASLDRYEGYPTAYDRGILKVRDDSGHIYEAVVYMRSYRNSGMPHEDYRDIVVQGAIDRGLPDCYIHSVLN